ncbi:Pre-mRNA-splicing factor cwf19 [Psilocybe cubensis]|uniref:Pre-mRNA-splicing factor cwf19 n=1 Tax=Psilocybe cubensis TaxID=181762 RepID=A0ACB8GZB1_PSICU|nr:Pre-mRNA-splicing factor cwf19 [Psilocybe cubensis]KAH9480566.1 Pre-mRNA-splicing factor cwf19 [Psilocybe cubensis]
MGTEVSSKEHITKHNSKDDKRDKREKHKKHKDDSDRKHKKRRKHEDDGEEDGGHRRHKHHKRDRENKRGRSGESKMEIVDDNPSDDNLWVEKDIDMGGERILASDIPTSESLKLTSSADATNSSVPLPHPTRIESTLKRDDWMMAEPSTPVLPVGARPQLSRIDYSVEIGEESLDDGYGELSGNSRPVGGGVDFFSSLGTEKKKPSRPDRPDPDKPKVHYKELNQDIKEGRPIDFDEPPPPPPSITPGGPGSQWRMMRLRRVYENAEEDGVPVEQLGIERFGSLQAFEEAKQERRILDEREGKRSEARGRTSERPTHYSRDGEKRLMFSDVGGSGGSSRSSSFRRPGGVTDSVPSTPSPPTGVARPPTNRRLDSLRLPSQASSPLAQAHTPIPTVMTPPPMASGSKSRPLSPSSLNKLQAKVIRAKLMDSPDAARLEQEYEVEARKAQGTDDGGVKKKVEVLPTLDARGRMYDVGHGKEDDRKTGEVLRINPDDDTMTLGEMLRQERMGAGMSDQKDLDAQYARAVMGDGKFENDLDYIDDNAEKLGRQKMRSDGMKRQFAINDYKRTQKVLASCNFCYGEDDSLPKAPIIATGTRVYLSCTLTDELVDGHCLIVPIQHHLNMLEGDDDVWDETRNFMKCLMRMYAEEDKGVVFFETVLSLRKQKHTYIECVPVPWEQFDLLPGYFKESILASEAEWSQHKKLIDFSARPGGFRRALVPNLPYFMVQFDHKGEKGYGHVIEGAADAQDEDGLEEGEKGGGEFPWYFAGEIIGNVLELEARRWRRPRRIDLRRNNERVAEFKKKYTKFDWTGML